MSDIWEFHCELEKRCDQCDVPLSEYRRDAIPAHLYGEVSVWCDQCDCQYEFYPIDKSTGKNMWGLTTLDILPEMIFRQNGDNEND